MKPINWEVLKRIFYGAVCRGLGGRWPKWLDSCLICGHPTSPTPRPCASQPIMPPISIAIPAHSARPTAAMSTLNCSSSHPLFSTQWHSSKSCWNNIAIELAEMFVSSVRSSSGYHGLIEIRQRPLYKIFQILQILKWKWKWKDPTCAIFFKSMGFKDIKYDIPVYQMWNTQIHKYTDTQIRKYTNI